MNDNLFIYKKYGLFWMR